MYSGKQLIVELCLVSLFMFIYNNVKNSTRIQIRSILFGDFELLSAPVL